MMSAERWVPVADWVGSYEVSDQGRVRSIDRVVVYPDGIPHRIAGRLLRATRDRHGYPTVFFKRNRVYTVRRVHQVVLETFVGPRPSCAVARHLNGIRHDCRSENLAWGTQSENSYDRGVHGTDHNRNKTHCPNKHEYFGTNLYIKPCGGRGCRACIRERASQYRKRQKAATA